MQANAFGDGLALLAAALPLMGSPGPAVLSCAATASAFGVRAALPYYFGIVAGTASVLLMVATGVTGLILALPLAAPVLATLGLCYMLYLAYRIATAPVLGEKPAEESERPGWKGGYLLAVANPKAFTVFGALFAGAHIAGFAPVPEAGVKIALLTGVIFFVNLVWVLAGAALARFLRHPRLGRAINIGFALLLLLSVGSAVWDMVWTAVTR